MSPRMTVMFWCYIRQGNHKSFSGEVSFEQLNSIEVGNNKLHFIDEESDLFCYRSRNEEVEGSGSLALELTLLETTLYFPVRREKYNIIKFIFFFFAV